MIWVVSKIHTVEQGECLSSIAKKYGFASWNIIYEYSENTDLKRIRENPNIIFPGDQIFIPEKAPRSEQCATGRKHTFKLGEKKTFLRLVLKNEEGQLLSNAKYKLVIEGVVREGRTDENGLIQQEIPTLDEDGELTVFPEDASEDDFTFHVRLGHLDPVNEVSGIQARLNNLGFDAGPIDGIDGPVTRGAVKAFQEEHGLAVDGIVGPQTQAKLKEVHGC